MLSFYASTLVKTLSDVQKLHHYAPMYTGKDQEWVEQAQRVLASLKEECKRVNFDSVVAQIERVETDVSLSQLIEMSPDSGTIAQMRTMINPRLDDIVEAVKFELGKRLFIYIPDSRKQWYSESDGQLFGKEVAGEFPKSAFDIAEAGRCFALERWDACAYHLMLAVEKVLHKWARRIKVKVKSPIGLTDWKPILDAATKESDRLMNLPKSVRREKQVSKLAEQIAHFKCIKDAYRNRVAHGRGKFDEGQSLSLLNHVKSFMESFV